MNHRLSLYLDLVRFGAAMVVYLGHLAGQKFTGGFLWPLGAATDDAVVVFFVLSGYVIAWVTHARHTSATDYGIARASRIYSVAVPAVVLTYLLDTVGTLIAPAAYAPVLIEHARPIWWEAVSSLTFLNQIWYLPTDIGSMLPYWSLGYEVWYYVIFGLAYFAPTRAKAVLWVALALLFVGPRIAVLFPLWLLGVGLYNMTARRPVSARVGAIAFSASLVLYALYHLYARDWLSTHDVVSGWIGEKYLQTRYAVAVIFALNLLGAMGLSQINLRINTSVERWVRRCAATTFTVYLVHLPVAQFITVITPWPLTHWASRTFMYLGTGAAIILMAKVSEQRKAWWADWFRSLLSATQPVRRDAPVG